MAVYSCAACKRIISSAKRGEPQIPSLDPQNFGKGRWSCPRCRNSFCDDCVPPAREVCPQCPSPDLLKPPPQIHSFGRGRGPASVLDAIAEQAGALAGSPPRPFFTFDYGRQRDPAARSILVKRNDAAAIVFRMRRSLPDGVAIFVGASRWPGEGQAEDQAEVVIAKASSQFDFPHIARTLASGYATTADALAARLIQFHKLYGLDLFQAESDAVVFKLKKLPTSLKVFCDDLAELCPTMAERDGGLAALADEIRDRDGVVSLRWSRGAPLDAVAAHVARLVGAPLRGYSTYDYGSSRDETARSVLVDAKEVRDLVHLVRDKALPEGFIAFEGSSMREEIPEGKAELVIARGESQFDCLRVARTELGNWNLSTDDVIAKLREYDGKWGIEIVQAETDSVGFRLLTWPESLETYAADLMAFCPDLKDHFFDEKDLAAKLKATETYLSLWWD